MSDSATRLVLSFPHVLEEFFSNFSPVPCWGKASLPLSVRDLGLQVVRVDRTSLASCALVCKTWSPFALDVLWAALPYSISPLFQLFTSLQQWLRIQHSSVRIEPPEKYEIPESERCRFQQYARRVRCILYHRRMIHRPPLERFSSRAGGFFDEDCASSLLSQLRKMNGGQPIFPNLRILHWTCLMLPFNMLALRTLAGPPMTPFYMEGIFCEPGQEDAALSSALDIVKVACPMLEHLHITGA
ncbi:hypothetical protein C8T65DRAFT_197027 [Cerioporus squamosus]|nr:hypothetical protein C8T65DRAFT_197027 [Cerioporus squamosus]